MADSPGARTPPRDVASSEKAGPGDPVTPSSDHEPTAPYLDLSDESVVSLEAGELLGNRYRLLRILGRGGMGEVWRAYDLKLRVEVALKCLRPEMFQAPDAPELLRREVRSAREVLSPNVCRIYDLEELDGQELVSMEYIDGRTLLDLLEERGPLDLREGNEIASQILAGVEAVHAAGLVHRDLKPENLMITRTGRVVIMDFGIAKPAATWTRTARGTPAYAAPEQVTGDQVDARADVYSLGVVLAEMISAEGGPRRDSRQTFWRAVHHDPPMLPESPWRNILLKALARDPQARYASATELARALEEVAFRVEGAEVEAPYPGLAPFTEHDAELFFGREAEVEAIWKRLEHAQLSAIVGGSGSGKTSFLRAGVIPAKPEGWGHLICTPGPEPFAGLALALQPPLSELDYGTEDLLEAIHRWREDHDAALLIIDQFEELFTQSPPEIQHRFCELLGRVRLDGDVHVVLSLRDDFLLRCQQFPTLRPLFSELAPIGPPTGSDLRRALIQPALRCGYRFEDESIVEEMLEEVSKERGALPLIAFAAARLWERRDRETGYLARDDYDQIGGVSGALAQHAEGTLEHVGADRIPIVRELFRNLVTAQGTRITRTRAELLSVFDTLSRPETVPAVLPAKVESGRLQDRDAAEEVLSILIDARLLISYEVPTAGDEPTFRHRVEVIHESLLSKWPRLVRWQTQDAAGAQLRDELRHQARVWGEKGRPEDLLWTGTAFQEFQVWRGRYSGRLSATEEAFAQAMTSLARRRRRRRRFAIAAAFTLLLAMLAVVGALWRTSETSRLQAEQEAERAEASKLLALGRLELDEGPTTALAYAIASLELFDTPETRRFALEALWKGPTAFRLPVAEPHGSCWPSFSRDGRWLAQDGEPGRVWLYPQDGSAPRALETVRDPGGTLAHFEFGPDSDSLVCTYWVLDQDRFDRRLGFWSVPGGRDVRTMKFEGPTEATLAGDRLVTATKTADGKSWLRSWPWGGGEPANLGHVDSPLWHVDPALTWLAWAKGRDIFLHSLGAGVSTSRPIVAHHPEPLRQFDFDPRGHRFASAGESGQIRLWSLAGGEANLLYTLEGSEALSRLAFHPSGSSLAWSEVDGLKLWNLNGPPEADPLELRASAVELLAFHPDGRWLYSTDPMEGAILWNLGRRYPQVLRGHKDWPQGLAFAPDGSWLASRSWFGEVRVWPLALAHQESRRTFAIEEVGAELRVGSEGKILVTTSGEGVIVVPVDGEPPTRLGGFPSGSIALSVALGPRERLVAAGTQRPGGRGEIRVWDLQTGEARRLDPGSVLAEGSSDDDAPEDTVSSLVFAPDGRLISAGGGGIISWNLEDGSGEVLFEQEGEFPTLALSAEGRHLVIADLESGDPAFARSKLTLVDLEHGTTRPVTSHGDRVQARALAFDPTGRILVTGDIDGIVRVGPVTGAEPHLLLGHKGMVESLAVSPDGQWVASGGEDGTLRLWPMPDLSKPPLHTLPYDVLLARLRSLTNLRVVKAPETPTGWKLEVGPFPGWEEAPTW